MTIMVIPTVLATADEDFDAKFARISEISDEVQVDLMDGRFVPTKSIDSTEVPDVRGTGKMYEAHLMVTDPMPWIPPLAKAGFARAILHIETIHDEDVTQGMRLIRKLGMKPILALNPETPIERVLPFISEVDAVLFLGVHPGRNGAPYVTETPDRIRALKAKAPTVVVQVDGGMTPETIGDVVRAGATRINSGSYVANAPDPKVALQQLRDAAEAAANEVAS